MPIHPEMLAGLSIWMSGAIIAGAAVLGVIALELAVRRLVPLAVRQRHNDVAGVMFTVVGTTYAVLLAFVASLAWEGYNKAQALTDTEASLVKNVAQLVDGLGGPEAASMQRDIVAYARAVMTKEWPEQARGEYIDEDEPHLQQLTETALRLRPGSIADGDVHTLLLDELEQLASTRRERLFAARTPIPAIIWFVLIAGGGITIAFSSALGAPSLSMQIVMSSALAISGVLVLLVVVALSNPFRGDYRISPAPFARVLARMAP